MITAEVTTRDLGPGSDLSPIADRVRIDLSLPFIPERLTHLYHTKIYSSLNEQDRLRYNQLHGLYFHEQTIFFETFMMNYVRAVARCREVSRDLGDALRRLCNDEEMHTRMFRRINLAAAPNYYHSGDFYLIRIPSIFSALLRITAKFPRYFPLYIWIMHIQEERSLYYAGEIARETKRLEPHFVKAQAIHVKDEMNHVDVDAELLELLWERNSMLVRQVNAKLFSFMMKEFFGAPKRSGLRVLDVLCYERPHLLPLLPELKSQLLGLSQSREYHLELYSRSIVPRTMKLFDRYSEFSGLGSGIEGYIPHPEIHL